MEWAMANEKRDFLAIIFPSSLNIHVLRRCSDKMQRKQGGAARRKLVVIDRKNIRDRKLN